MDPIVELVGTLGAWQSPGICRQVGGHGCGRNKENQKVGGGGGGWWWGALSPWVKSPTTTKEEGMSKEQKQTEQKEAGK